MGLSQTDSTGIDFGSFEPELNSGQNLTEVQGEQEVDIDFGSSLPVPAPTTIEPEKGFFDRPLAGFVDIGANIVRASGNFYRTLDNWQRHIMGKVGLEPGELGFKLGEAVFGEGAGGEFKPIHPAERWANDLDQWANYLDTKGIDPSNSTAKTFKAIYSGIGLAAVDLPLISKLGLPGFSAFQAGGAAIEEGDDDVALATLGGAAHGMVLHGILQAGAFLPRGARVPLMSMIFAGESLKTELEKPPDERDYAQTIADGIIGGGLTIAGKGLTIAELKRTPRVIEAAGKLKVEIEENRILESMEVAQRVAEIRGEELGVSKKGERRVSVDEGERATVTMNFKKLNESERKIIREVDLDELPPTIRVEGREKEGVKTDISVKFIDESVTEANKPVEQYEMNIGGVKTDFFVSRARGENVRDAISEQIAVYVDPMNTLEVRSKATATLKEKNFGLQKQLTERYHEWVRGEVKEKLKKEFKESAVVDGEGNPIRVYHGTDRTFVNFIPKGLGVFFTNNSESANAFSFGLQPSVRPAFLKIKNPLDHNKTYNRKVLVKLNESIKANTDITSDVFIGDSMTGVNIRELLGARIVDTNIMRKVLSDSGFDGITYLGELVATERVWIAFNDNQIINNFETYAKHQEKIIKNQPPPPNVSNRDMTFSELLEIIPRRLGGKWPDDKPAVDVFADSNKAMPDVNRDIMLAKEEALGRLIPDIKTYNDYIDTLRRLRTHVNEGIAGKDKVIDRFRIWFADPALLFAEKMGLAGGVMVQKAIKGMDKSMELLQVMGFYKDKIDLVYKKVDWNKFEKTAVKDRVMEAIQDRENSSRILKSEEETELFNNYTAFLDHLIPDVAERAKVEKDYFPRMQRKATAIDQIVDGITRGDYKVTQDALGGKVYSPFLEKRQGELEDYITDPEMITNIYGPNIIKSLAFKDAVDYYTKPVKKGSKGESLSQFDLDVPKDLRIGKSFNKVRTEMNEWLRGILTPASMHGRWAGLVQAARRNIYPNLLNWNIRASLDNSTQWMFNLAFTPKETWDLYKQAWKGRKRIEEEAPFFTGVLDKAGKDQVFMMEVDEVELTGMKGKRYGRSKLSEFDPWIRSERMQWNKSEVAGVVEEAWKHPDWEKTLVKNEGDIIKSVEELLERDTAFQRRATINAQQLSRMTQFMPGAVNSPHIFRTQLGKFAFILKRFSAGNIELMFKSMRTSGTDGIAALRILSRGFPEEVEHVEALRSVETFRKGLEEVEELGRKFPKEANVDMATVTKMRRVVTEIEKDLNDTLAKLQPINKNNKSTQIKLWSTYTAKRWVYAFFYNALANIALDTIGVGASEEMRKKDPIARALLSASQNITPFLWEARDPGGAFFGPMLPDVGGPFASSRQKARGMIRWGFNVVPYAGRVDRLTGRVASDFIVNQLTPKKTKERRGL